MMKKLVSAIIALIMITSSVDAFAAEMKLESYEYKLAAKTLTDNYGMWHYSGGKWKIGDERGNGWEFTDAQVGAAISIGRKLETLTDAVYTYELPEEILRLFDESESCGMHLSISGGNIDFYSIFNASTISYSYQRPNIIVKVRPSFNVSSLRSFDDYVAGLNISLPLIDYTYGRNLYAMFSNGASYGKSDGIYWDSMPGKMAQYYMHPGLIKDSSGMLYGGYEIDTEAGRKSTENLNVGWGTFKNGGALGLYFYFPMTLQVTVSGTRYVAVYEEKKESTGSSSNTNPPSNPPANDNDSYYDYDDSYEEPSDPPVPREKPKLHRVY